MCGNSVCVWGGDVLCEVAVRVGRTDPVVGHQYHYLWVSYHGLSGSRGCAWGCA